MCTLLLRCLGERAALNRPSMRTIPESSMRSSTAAKAVLSSKSASESISSAGCSDSIDDLTGEVEFICELPEKVDHSAEVLLSNGKFRQPSVFAAIQSHGRVQNDEAVGRSAGQEGSSLLQSP